MSRSIRFDVEALYVTLDAERRTRKLRWKDVGDQADVSASTFTRMGLHHRCPDAENLAKILLWLGNTDLKPFIRAEVSS